MLLDRADDDNLTLPNTTTRMYLLPQTRVSISDALQGLMGFDGVVLEVMEYGYVLCVMLF